MEVMKRTQNTQRLDKKETCINRLQSSCILQYQLAVLLELGLGDFTIANASVLVAKPTVSA